ncbi:uncharacterized protein LOC135395891 [Ornithodoros turicata]|uniref:uncharacterized protein LOC135395891 n=1 Tax=Ornithodoros turicata TaxID=34597 RepID=UPI00313A43C6
MVRICIPCQRSKVHLHTVSPHAGCRFILTAVDRYTRWPEATPIPDPTAKTVASAFLATRVTRFGVPSQVTTDRGRQFESNLFSSFTRLIGTSRICTTSYQPASNGLVERLHRTLKAALTAFEDRVHWTDHLPLALLGILTSLKPDHGWSSAELPYGRTLHLPGEFLFPSSPEETRVTAPDILQRLRRIFDLIRPVPRRPGSLTSLKPSTTLPTFSSVQTPYASHSRPSTPVPTSLLAAPARTCASACTARMTQ